MIAIEELKRQRQISPIELATLAAARLANSFYYVQPNSLALLSITMGRFASLTEVPDHRSRCD